MSRKRTGGRISLGGIALVLAVGIGVYWGIFFAPLYLDNVNVGEAVATALNQSQRDDESLRKLILERTNQREVGSHYERDAFGNAVLVPGLGIKPEQVTIVRNFVAKTIAIEVDYEREVVLRPSSVRRTVRFAVRREGALGQ